MVHSLESSTYRGAKHPGVPALALRNFDHGHHSCQRGYTRSCAVRLLQFGAVQNQQLSMQKVPPAPWS